MTVDAPPRRRRAWIGWTVFGVLVAIVFCIAWIGIRGVGAAVALSSAAQGAKDLRTMVVEGSTDDVAATAKRIEADASNARTLTSDPVWRAAEVVPWLGGNMRAVRQVSEVADDIASRGISPLLDAAKGADLGTLGIKGGHIDLEPLTRIAPPLAEAAIVFGKAERAVRDIDTAGTIAPLASAVNDLVDEVDTVSRATAQLAGAAELLPTMLGGPTQHTYLLLMQNNAELRSSGGNPGAFAIITAKDGTVRLGAQADSTDFRKFSPPVAKLSEPMTALFGEDPAIRIQNTLNAPDFPTGAQLASTMWTKTMGGHLDGVIAVDAVVVSYLLKATGPIDIKGVTLSPETATAYLLGGVYKALPEQKQSDTFFRAVAATVFAKLTDGTTPPRKVLSALAEAGDSDRVRLWSADADTQARILATSLAGTIPEDSADAAHVAVLMNDTTGGKMDYFADAAVDARIGTCGKDGRTSVRVTVNWKSSAPADAATALPDYVTAAGWWGVPPGITSTRIAVFGPQGWAVTAKSADGEVHAEAETVDAERQVVQYELRTPPGGTQRMIVEFTAPHTAVPSLDVLSTPMIRSTPVHVGELACG